MERPQKVKHHGGRERDRENKVPDISVREEAILGEDPSAPDTPADVMWIRDEPPIFIPSQISSPQDTEQNKMAVLDTKFRNSLLHCNRLSKQESRVEFYRC